MPCPSGAVSQPTFIQVAASRMVTKLWPLVHVFDDIELGLRLRYEIIREIAPYVGINWERALGDAADELEDEGETIDSFAGVAGIRFWF